MPVRIAIRRGAETVFTSNNPGAFKAGISRYFAQMRHEWQQNEDQILTYLGDLWVNIVQSTAYITHVPAKRSSIIVKRIGRISAGKGILQVGWHNYPGGNANERLSWRRRMWEDTIHSERGRLAAGFMGGLRARHFF